MATRRAGGLFRVEGPALPANADVLSFHGQEQLLQPYRFEIHLRVTGDDAFDIEDAVGTQATLSIDVPGQKAPFAFHGTLASVEHLHEAEGHAIYQAALVPRLWHLSQSHHSRIFTNQTIPSVIEDILGLNGFGGDDFELRLRASYPEMVHVCQYHESDLAFITRWMEREGMYYFFEQGDSVEKLVIVDHVGAHVALSDDPVRYRPGAGGDQSAGEQSFSFFRGKAQAIPQKVTLRDYDYANPKLDVSGNAPIWDRGRGEIHVHGENFTTPGDGARLAAVRAEEHLAHKKVFLAHGRVFMLRPGYTFQVQEHPRPSFNDAYLITALEHHGNQSVTDADLRDLLDVEYDDEYRAEIVAIPAKRQFRPRRETSKPRIYGIENGVIDGPASSQYAQMNAAGCYKVKIDFDESGLNGGQASTWVRMLQPHGGTNEGFHFPLRAATEVMLSFQGGDPDKPVIVGVVPNALTGSPVDDGNKVLNVIQTGAKNRIEMSDEAGSEHVHISTPKHDTFLKMGAKVGSEGFFLNTAGDGYVNVDRTMTITVDQTQSETVIDAVTEDYNNSQTTTVNGDGGRVLTVTDGPLEEEVRVGDHITNVGGEQSVDVDKATSHDYCINEGDFERNVSSTFKELVANDGSQTVTAAKTFTHDIGGSSYVEEIDAGGNISQAAAGRCFQQYGGSGSGDDAACTHYMIVHGKQKVTIEGPSDVEHLDTSSVWTYGAKVDYFAGLHSTTFMGVKNANFLGAQLNITLAFKADFELSGSFKMFFAPALKLGLAPDTQLSSAIELHEKNLRITSLKTDLESVQAKVVKASVASKTIGALIKHIDTYIIS